MSICTLNCMRVLLIVNEGRIIMTIYLFLLIIVFLGINTDRSDAKSKRYCAIVFLVMWVIVGLRHVSLGLTDTEWVYSPLINKCINMNFGEIYHYFKTSDYGFFFLVKIISFVSKDLNFILFILSAPYLFAITSLIYKHSKIKWLSFLLFCGLGYFGVSFYLLRQVTAIAIVLYSLDYLIDKKLIKFLIIVLIASLFHQTALVFLIAYPVSLIEVSWKNLVYIPVCFALSIALEKVFLKYIFIILSYVMSDTGRYDNYLTDTSSLSLTEFFIFILVIFMVYLLYFKRILGSRKLEYSDQKEMKILFNMVLIGECMLPFTLLLGEVSRLASYFTIFSIILLPNAVKESISRRSNRVIILSVVGGIFTLYFLFVRLGNSNLAPYRFFWMN